MNTFLTLGTNTISSERFINIVDPDNALFIKPTNGLWCTEQYPEFVSYNPWIDFLLSSKQTLYKKYNDSNIIPASLITLNDNANIFYLNNLKQLNILKKFYPSNNSLFSYEKLSLDYDGIYIDLKLMSELDSNLQKLFQQFCVSSLVLFNTNAILYYQKANVKIELGPDLGYLSENYYEINIDPEINFINEVILKK